MGSSGSMRLKTHRGVELERQPGAALFRDVNEQDMLRAIWLVDEQADSLETDGDVAGLLEAARGDVLFRFVQFSAADDLAALVQAYHDGFGRLVDDLALAKALAIDPESRAMVSMSVWKDRATLDRFLEHDGFVPAQAAVMGLLARPPVAETLQPEPSD